MNRGYATLLWAWAAGLSSGFAFSTRYALVPFFIAGLLFIYSNRHKRLGNMIFYSLGFLLPSALVIIRNYLVSGSILPTALKSNVGIKVNIIRTIGSLLGKNIGVIDPTIEAAFIGLLVFLVLSLLIIKRVFWITLKEIFLGRDHKILSLWIFSYLIFLNLIRTRSHFDLIGVRLVAPASIVMIILWSGMLAKVIRINGIYLFMAFLAIVVFVEASTAIKIPPVNPRQCYLFSERLNWIAQNTSNNDLIIGDDTIDIPFYLNRPFTMSFSTYPYTNYPTYEKIIYFCLNNQDKFNNFYLVIRDYSLSRNGWLQSYGLFFADIVYGQLKKYPDIVFIQRLTDAFVFKINIFKSKKRD
jgi:hypothetical protein